MHLKLLVLVMMMMEENLEDGMQIINILKTLSTTCRKTASISNARRLDWKEARIDPSPPHLAAPSLCH